MSTLPPSTANWHWKNKNVTAWGKSWFERELVTVQIKGDGSEVVSITEVSDVDGDVELGQRKSKLITIYDCKIDLKWSGTASDGTEVNGKLRIPEVSHEITLDGLSDYVYDWKLSTPSTPAVDKLFALVKKKMPEALEAKFSAFPAAITEIHGKDLQVSSNAASAEPSRTGTPAPAPVPTVGSGASSSASAPKAVKQDKPVNTTTVDVEASFMASADDLFEMMTDENKISMWTRAPAQSKPEPNGSFSLLGGGVKGTYVSLEKPKKIVQKWALSSPTWPTGHAATLTFSFDQSSESTKLTISLDGVPKGMEEEIKRNLEGYYIQGLKSIGYVQVVYSEPTVPPPSRYQSVKNSGDDIPQNNDSSSRVLAIVLAAVVVLGAFAIPILQKLGSVL